MSGKTLKEIKMPQDGAYRAVKSALSATAYDVYIPSELRKYIKTDPQTGRPLKNQGDKDLTK